MLTGAVQVASYTSDILVKHTLTSRVYRLGERKARVGRWGRTRGEAPKLDASTRALFRLPTLSLSQPYRHAEMGRAAPVSPQYSPSTLPVATDSNHTRPRRNAAQSTTTTTTRAANRPTMTATTAEEEEEPDPTSAKRRQLGNAPRPRSTRARARRTQRARERNAQTRTTTTTATTTVTVTVTEKARQARAKRATSPKRRVLLPSLTIEKNEN